MGLGTGTRSPSLAAHQPLQVFSSSCVFLGTPKGSLSHRSQLNPTGFFSLSGFSSATEQGNLLFTQLCSADEELKKPSQMQLPSLRGSVLGWQRQGEMDPAAKAQGQSRTPKQSSPADAEQSQESHSHGLQRLLQGPRTPLSCCGQWASTNRSLRPSTLDMKHFSGPN